MVASEQFEHTYAPEKIITPKWMEDFAARFAIRNQTSILLNRSDRKVTYGHVSDDMAEQFSSKAHEGPMWRD